ncbi:MAG: glycerophosphodiester phosphodiesterase [Flavobacteriaceae bacterium]
MKPQLLFGMFLFSLLSCTSSPRPLVIGHRGARGHVAENTVASVKKAMELGVDGIEIDVFVCASGELVVFHDKTLEQLTDATGYIENIDLDSIRKITVLGSEPIPTLDEVLATIQAHVVLNIELKGAQTAQPTYALLKEYFEAGKLSPKDVFISSFNWEELALFYAETKEVPIAVLTEDDPLDAIPVASQLAAFAINPNHKSLTTKNVKKIHEAGFKIYPWTINEPNDIERMKSLGVDAIITDYPERVFPQ